MADKKTNWVRDLLLVPLIVGVIVAFASFVLPKFFDKDKEISYSIETPIEYLDQDAVKNIDIQVNGTHVTSLIAYKVHIWNSGDIPLTVLPIRFVFDTEHDDFTVFNTSHNTQPKEEFGKILEEGSNVKSKRFIYELLNPDDKDIVTFLCNQLATIEVYTKAEGLKKKKHNPKKVRWYELAGVSLPVLGVFLSLFFNRLKKKYLNLRAWLRVAKKSK